MVAQQLLTLHADGAGAASGRRCPTTPQLALGFKLATSPPLAVAWAAAFSIDALTCLGPPH